MARQPIFDTASAAIGYELLFRSGGTNAADFVDANQATSRVVVNTFLDFGVEAIVGPGRLAFVNATRAFVLGQLPLPLAPGSIVLEILTGVVADPDLLAGVARLRAEGWQFCLDDFVWTPATEALLDHADYVKLDASNTAPDVLARIVGECRRRPVQLVAMKVETEDQLQLCKSLGFDYFQGWYFSHPEIVTGSRLSPGQLQLMQLIATLADPNVSPSDVEQLVRADAGLSFRCLRAANSAGTGARRRIGTLREAIMMLGLRQLRNWVLLMSLASATGSEHDISEVMTRARMCESLMEAATGDRDAGFIAGLISGFDTLLGKPLPEVVESVTLRDDIVAALLTGDGVLGEALGVVRGYVRGEVPSATRPEWEDVFLRRAYLDAIAWSLQLWASIAD